MSILEIITAVAATNSPIEKAAILRQHAGNETLKTVCQLANDPLLCWYTTHTERPKTVDGLISLDQAIDTLLTNLATRKVTGNAAKALVEETLGRLLEDDAEIVRRLINKDLRAGFGESICNKVWPGLVQKFDFMLCETTSDKIVYPAISQLKADGMRCAMKIEPDGSYTLMSRNGKFLNDLKSFADDAKWIASLTARTTILDGELVCYKDGKVLDRKTSNGILNKAINNTISPEEAALIHFVGWDVVDTTSTIDYINRSEFFCFLSLRTKKILVIESTIVNSEKEAFEHFRKLRRAGHEGTILKNMAGKWVPKRTKDQVKYKAEIEAEFRVTGFEYGTGKNAKRVGAIFVESECGLVKSKVGIFKDMDDSVRDDLLTNMPKVVTVLYNERINDKARKDGTESLFLPRVTALRYDKDTANTREEMIAIEKAILEHGT